MEKIPPERRGFFSGLLQEGYLFGYLIYPSYQTEGSYAGTALATSPDFGLVAGVQSYGAGKVLFVNLPLTYLKGRTDALPMQR